MCKKTWMMILAPLFLIALVALSAPASGAENATITGDSVRLRSFPGLSYGDIVGQLKKGTRVEVTSETDFLDTIDGSTAPWYELSYGGQTGFVFGRYVELDAGVTVFIGDPSVGKYYSYQVSRFVRDGLGTFGTSDSYIIKRLGQPISITEIEGGGAGEVNHRLTYDGISFDIYGPKGEQSAPFGITCTSGSYEFSGLKVGSSVTDVKFLLGDPDSVEGGTLTYQSSTLVASFKIQNGKVIEITLMSISYD